MCPRLKLTDYYCLQNYPFPVDHFIERSLYDHLVQHKVQRTRPNHLIVEQGSKSN